MAVIYEWKLVLAGQGHEDHGAHVVGDELVTLLHNLPHGLIGSHRADGDDQLPAIFELRYQTPGHVVGSCGYDDVIEGSMFLPAVVPIGVADVDVDIIQHRQALLGLMGQFRNDLHRVHLFDQA